MHVQSASPPKIAHNTLAGRGSPPLHPEGVLPRSGVPDTDARAVVSVRHRAKAACLKVHQTGLQIGFQLIRNALRSLPSSGALDRVLERASQADCRDSDLSRAIVTHLGPDGALGVAQLAVAMSTKEASAPIAPGAPAGSNAAAEAADLSPELALLRVGSSAGWSAASTAVRVEWESFRHVVKAAVSLSLSTLRSHEAGLLAAPQQQESEADKLLRRQRQWQLILESAKRELGTGDQMQKLVSSLDTWSATVAALGSGGVLVEHTQAALQQQAVAGLTEVDAAMRTELDATSGGHVDPETGLQPYEQAGQRLAKRTGGGLTSASKAVATLREAGGTSSSVAAMALMAELDGAVSRAVGVRFVGQPAAAGGSGASSRSSLSSARAAKEGAIVAAHADTTADDMANAGWDPDTEAADQQSGSSAIGAAASAGAHPWAAVVDEAVASVRSDYVTWWSSRKQKWDASVARAKGPTSFKLPAPPASANSDVGALLRHFFRTEFTEVFLHGQDVTDEGLKEADERDRQLARAERECRAQWSAMLGAPRLTEAAKEAVAAAAEDAADLATGGGPATKYIAASMLAADAPASELRHASLQLAVVMAKSRASAAARRELALHYAAVTAAAQQSQEAALVQINEQRDLRSVTAFLQSEVRLLVCEAATARYVAAQTLASALTSTPGMDATQVASHLAMYAGTLANLAEPPAGGPAAGNSIASLFNSCVDIEAQRQQGLRIEQAAAEVSDNAKQFVGLLLMQLREWMKGQNNGKADATLVESIDNTANAMVKQASELSADSKRIVEFTVRLIQTMHLSKQIVGSTSALEPDDVPMIDAGSLLTMARPEAGIAAAEAIARGASQAAAAASLEAQKARLVTADDVAAALGLACDRGVPGARDAFRRAALSVSDGPAGAKQMATLPERELVASAVEVQRRGRYLAQLEGLVKRHKADLGTTIRQKRGELKSKHTELAASLSAFADKFAAACKQAGAPMLPRVKRPRPGEEAAAAQAQGEIVVPQATVAPAGTEEPAAKRPKVE
ncbi:hypothetical protein FNF29_06300 [Cafeteria roenbergensis]|uniref:Uncharacterized protein n=1 Tax=Cafeteria roenbergensis TaxID=33653 RepID=A0A5A8C8T9_CAFRO|nr:hypothetical protein FNF29_06300 [Cafeteria roenbergensis]|eukprot:KAA0149009.1 hypothetical protein FNF29_06300 [Cafeteria roenbergensis]